MYYPLTSVQHLYTHSTVHSLIIVSAILIDITPSIRRTLQRPHFWKMPSRIWNATSTSTFTIPIPESCSSRRREAVPGINSFRKARHMVGLASVMRKLIGNMCGAWRMASPSVWMGRILDTICQIAREIATVSILSVLRADRRRRRTKRRRWRLR